MQYDMHYYATYAMAAAAGIEPAHAQIIATSAQFVDDQNVTAWVLTASQEGILGVATAHHPLEAGVRTLFGKSERNDTRPVWVPFHFLPGAEGSNFQEKMVCRQDSAVVNQLLDYYLRAETLEAHRDHALHLMGIAAHVYADTFSHYGFSGLSTEANDVELESIVYHESHSSQILEYIEEKKDVFLGFFAEAAKLGHGAVLTNPDRPYLKWSFRYQDGTLSERSNPETFLQACEKLYKRFVQFACLYYGKPVQPLVAWEALKNPVAALLAMELPADERVRAWMEAMKKGKLGAIAVCAHYDDKPWLDEIHECKRKHSAAEFVHSNPYRFFVAADYHRNYVLKRLLPSFGLMVA